jgi:hypothetical protein
VIERRECCHNWPCSPSTQPSNDKFPIPALVILENEKQPENDGWDAVPNMALTNGGWCPTKNDKDDLPHDAGPIR